ncbi:MAG TPA: hypothetical protein VM427_01685 [Patescibacteria group bacterium]|nr:hypothetical protein [Patescibacteria group bacterium]
MTAPATPIRPVPTHPCARCGAPVGLDVGLCERCNPLGLKDSASSQVHGTVFLAVGLAIAGLALAAHLAVAGVGPFSATVTGVRAGAAIGTVVATIEIRNEGTALGSASCRLTDPADRGVIDSSVLTSPRVGPGATIRFEHVVPFGDPGRLLTVTCSGP